MRSRYVAAALYLVFGWAALHAQVEERGTEPARGDRHSVGWDKALRLKGPPVAPKFPKLGEEIERVVLDNGMIVYIQEDHRLPLVDAVMLVRTGTYYESPEEIGTARLAGDLLRSGGTTNLPPEQLDERLDFIAAQLRVGMGEEQASISLNVPQKDADEGLRILADVIRNPRFDESRLELAKRQAVFALRSSNDSPAPIIRREFARLLFTSAHPSGRTPTVEQIESISRDDIIAFHKKFFHPNQIMIGLTGDFNKAEMLEKVRELWGDWPKAAVTLPPLPKVDPQPKPGIYYVEKQLDQSSLRIGHWGANRDNPDRFAIDLMNNILGGSDFSSRMTERVRNDEGLAYDAGTAFPTGQRDISFFIAVAQTKTETTVKAINSIVEVIRSMLTSSVSQNEFQTAKEMFLYSYVFRYADPGRSLAALMRLEYDGLPPDYLEKEFAAYQAVTPEDINRVARKYLQPEELTIFVVGDYPKFAEEISKLGQPHRIEPLTFDGGGPPQAPARP